MGCKNLSFRLGQLLLAVIAVAGSASGQVKTTVADSLFAPDGTAATGTLTIRAHQTFTAADGTTVNIGVAATATVGANGSFSVQLVPNVGGAPMGNYYDVSFVTSTRRVDEVWIVPESSANRYCSVFADHPAC
jgi:hypothetical protein